MSRAEQANVAAAQWLLAQAEGPLSPERQAEFEAWLAASDGNKAAYWRLEYGWRAADRIGALGPGPADPIMEPARARRRWWVPGAVAASVALAFAVQQFAIERPAPSREAADAQVATRSYETPLGGKRLVGLEDGSRVQLNTQSKVRTAITAARRDVWLDRGEAFFEVAHRAGRPFVVHAGDRQVTVLGTKFSVRRDRDRVMVTVLEGRVRVDELNDNQPRRSSVIAAGNIAMASGAATLVKTRSRDQVVGALSWREGLLTFDEEPLTVIAAEFNRYNAKKLVLEGESVGSIRITGTFPADRPDAFARLLRDAYGIDVDETDSRIRVSR